MVIFDIFEQQTKGTDIIIGRMIVHGMNYTVLQSSYDLFASAGHHYLGEALEHVITLTPRKPTNFCNKTVLKYSTNFV